VTISSEDEVSSGDGVSGSLFWTTNPVPMVHFSSTYPRFAKQTSPITRISPFQVYQRWKLRSIHSRQQRKRSRVLYKPRIFTIRARCSHMSFRLVSICLVALFPYVLIRYSHTYCRLISQCCQLGQEFPPRSVKAAQFLRNNHHTERRSIRFQNFRFAARFVPLPPNKSELLYPA